jgi:3-deoxy-alpha-D-manno-octulosonate 8-oxidase
MKNILDTGVRVVKNVNAYEFGVDSIFNVNKIVNKKIDNLDLSKRVVVFVDEFFKNSEIISVFGEYEIIFVSTKIEPTTVGVDLIMQKLNSFSNNKPSVIIGFGGGITMDTAKACSNLFNNQGPSEKFQGWDLVKNPGVYKIGIPTISGTGAEATRTCVLTNISSGLKLGMNSDHTVFDYVIMDPNLLKTVPKNQFFYTGMDAYIHCLEALEGSYRNLVGDSFSNQTLSLCREVFNSSDMFSLESREKIMVASFLGGSSIAMSYVGIVHPFSAGLGVVLGIHHCEANCIVMNAMEEFYPKYFQEFHQLARKQGMSIKKGIASSLSKSDYDKLYDSTIIHEKPLFNALGADFRKILNKEKVKQIFKKM